MCRTGFHKFFKNLRANSKFCGIKVQRFKNYADEPKVLGALLQYDGDQMTEICAPPDYWCEIILRSSFEAK